MTIKDSVSVQKSLGDQYKSLETLSKPGTKLSVLPEKRRTYLERWCAGLRASKWLDTLTLHFKITDECVYSEFRGVGRERSMSGHYWREQYRWKVDVTRGIVYFQELCTWGGAAELQYEVWMCPRFFEESPDILPSLIHEITRNATRVRLRLPRRIPPCLNFRSAQQRLVRGEDGDDGSLTKLMMQEHIPKERSGTYSNAHKSIGGEEVLEWLRKVHDDYNGGLWSGYLGNARWKYGCLGNLQDVWHRSISYHNTYVKTRVILRILRGVRVLRAGECRASRATTERRNASGKKVEVKEDTTVAFQLFQTVALVRCILFHCDFYRLDDFYHMGVGDPVDDFYMHPEGASEPVRLLTPCARPPDDGIVS
tara:strand:+ start:208 stop:1308 length:1101 start_codon:yes stop_codon:yes gene_type:complete